QSQRTYGTLGRNAFRGPARTNFDVSIAKITNIDEVRRLEFRADMFNALNHPLFRNPSTNIAGTTFGQVSSTGSATDSQPRIIQPALNLICYRARQQRRHKSRRYHFNRLLRSTFSDSRLRNIAITSARPTAASAAATTKTKKTKTCPLICPC